MSRLWSCRSSQSSSSAGSSAVRVPAARAGSPLSLGRCRPVPGLSGNFLGTSVETVAARASIARAPPSAALIKAGGCDGIHDGDLRGPEAWAARKDPARREAYWASWIAYVQALRQSGIMKARQRPATARDRRPPSACATAGGRCRTARIADTKEQLGGYFIIDVPDLDAALDWAARCPAAAGGAVEVRPVMVMQPGWLRVRAARAKPPRRWRAPPTAGSSPISSARSRDVAAAEDALADAFARGARDLAGARRARPARSLAVHRRPPPADPGRPRASGAHGGRAGSDAAGRGAPGTRARRSPRRAARAAVRLRPSRHRPGRAGAADAADRARPRRGADRLGVPGGAGGHGPAAGPRQDARSATPASPSPSPRPTELPERLEAVLDAIYAAYGSGWEDAAGADARRKGLAEEAIWLARLVAALLPDEPEARGLLALMLYCEVAQRAPAATRPAPSCRCPSRTRRSGRAR